MLIALRNGDRQAVNRELAVFKNPNGSVNYVETLKIYERLPGMMARDYDGTLAIVVGAITRALEALNLKRPMNPHQIIEAAETALESSTEDYIALEDILIFLQGLVRGKYGELYESLDVPKFMMLFDKYREERFEALQNFRDEQHSQHKILPVNDRISDMFPDEFKERQREAQMNQMRKDAGSTGNNK